jgi:glycine/D-amino acid oxidase-like deaminating enzyme
MTRDMADVVICGAGMAGISAAYHLAVKQGVRDILLVDKRAPLTLTSDKSTECYRNWWPGPGDAMVSLMNRSIDIMEGLAQESGNIFGLNRRGYLYATADPSRIVDLKNAAEEAAQLGAGAIRCHPGPAHYVPAPAEGFDDQPTGSDLILDSALISEHFPYLSERTVAVLHARRCGWLSAQQLGMYLLEQAREHGVRFRQARVEGVDLAGGHVRAVRLEDGTTIPTNTLVIAAGPFSKQVARLIGVDLPLFCELHTKVIFKDEAGVLPRGAPLLIWIDPVELSWSEEERMMFAESEETRWLLARMPSGVHGRPMGGVGIPFFLMQWTIGLEPVEPVESPRFDPSYPEIVVRGLAAMLPALENYFGKLPRPIVDGGYYTKTRENRPLIGPLPVQGAFMTGALSGFGVMSSCAAGELLAMHVTGGALPSYAPAFRLERYRDPAYQELLENWGSSGQI